MPTAYLKKLATLNHISVDKLEKFWSQAKEIAKSEGQGKSWGLITTIFQNKLKKEGYKVKAFTSLADTDELDDADLGINVDPKEYHKQKSLQMSLQSKLDMIKKDLNKEADSYVNKLEKIAKRLNEENRKRYSRDNEGDKWLHYNGTVSKEVLLEAYKDGIACWYEGFGTITSDEDIRYELNYYKNSVYPRFKKLINGSSLRVYRGLDFHKLFYSDVDLLKNYFKYLKYNLMDRNSWTTSIEIAKRYINYPWFSIILRMDCTLEDANLPLSAWLEGYWFAKNKEINLKKSLKVKNIKCVFVGEDLKSRLGFDEKEFNKVAAMYEPDRLDDETQKYFDNLNHTKELTKESTPTLLAMLKHSYFKNVKDNIKQIWARSMNSEQTANDWLIIYYSLIVECEKLAIEPKVCARMCYIKYHKENPHTKHLNKNNDVSFNTLKKEALRYFEGLRKWKEENKEFMKNQVTSSVETITKVNKDGTKYVFEKLSSVKDVIELLKNIDVLHDYFDKDEDYFKDKYGVSKKEATLFDLPWDEDTIVFIKYSNGKEWYSINEHSKLSDLKLTGIKDATFEWNGDIVSFYGKDCKIEKFDKDDEYSSWVVTCSNTYLYQGQVITASSKYEVISYRPQFRYLGFTPNSVKDYLKHFDPIEQVCVNDYNLYRKEVARLLKPDYKELIVNKIKFDGLLKLCFEAKVSTYDAYRWIDYIHVYKLI